MDVSGVILYFQGLIASSLVVINLMLGGFSLLVDEYFDDLSFTESVATQSTPVATSSTTQRIATSSASATTTATTTKKTVVKKAVSPVQASTTVASLPKTPLAPLLSAEQVNTNTRASLVNILCTAQGGGVVRSISGSGIIIDSRGVVLTNAHIAQYLLLRDYPFKNAVDCVIRTGNPAGAQYRAQLLYLPPAWIDENASQITAEHGLGTGENDYAFLLINETTNPQATLPVSFTNIAMTAATPDTGEQVLVAGYPAGFLDAINIEKNLYMTSAFTLIGKLYTFNDPAQVDVVSLGGTVVSQGGSSGGAVVRTYDGKLTGLIATATSGTTTADRDLRAITIGYINRSLAAQGEGGIAEFFSRNISQEASDFANTTFITEKKKLVDALSAAGR